MSRMSTLWKASPRKVLLAFAGLMVAAAIAVGSGANFNSTSANPSNVFTAGSIAHSNSKAGAAIFTASNMVPGGTTNGTVDIRNTGSATGTFSLSPKAAVNTPASPGLSTKLTLSIVDNGDPALCTTTCPTSNSVYSGLLSAAPPTIPLTTFAPGAAHRYSFTVTFPDSGVNGADNAYQGASTTVEYDWASTS
jgi:spore coat-associated protein N